MQLPSFESLYQKADLIDSPISVAVAGGADKTILQAYRTAINRGWVTPFLLGPESLTRAVAEEHAIDLHGFRFIHTNGPDVPRATVALVREGRAQVIAKGQVPTPELMKAVLDSAHGLRTGRIVAQHVLMNLTRDNRRLLLADTGITIRPSLEQKVDLVDAICAIARVLGVPSPHIAIVAASEKVSEAMPETIDATELTRRAAAGAFPGAFVQGPLSFDLAYAREAGDKKHFDGPVVGAADALLFPDLVSANLTVKAIMYTADCQFGGILHGTTHPVAFMSRADTTQTRLNSLALALAILRYLP
jgi:phosphate butyryltransferase